MTDTVYSRAADMIRRDGWWQQGSGAGQCLATAVGRSCREMQHPEGFGPLLALAAHLGLATWTDIYEWNDAPERSVEDVYMVLKELHEASS